MWTKMGLSDYWRCYIYICFPHMNNLLSPAAPKARDGRYCNALRLSVCPSVRPSVHPSVTFSFRTVTQKRINVFSQNFAGTCTMSWGVFCIVFDIDGMLFEFFKYWKKYNFFFFQYFMFSSRFVLFPTLKKNWCKKKISFSFHVLCYFQH